MTTYDEIYELFEAITYIDGFAKPKNVEEQYLLIQNALMLFNNRLGLSVIGNNEEEVLNQQLSQDEMLVLINYMKIVVVQNAKTLKNSFFQTFSSHIKAEGVTAQLNSLKDTEDKLKADIDYIIFRMNDDEIMV